MPKNLTGNLNGLLLIDKPEGMSSAALVSRIKRWTRAAKAGHAGTLDPFATGLMIVSLGKATRLNRFLLHGSKSYEALMALGIETDTYDRTGKITATTDILEKHVDPARILDVFNRFKGRIQQKPPVYSALKHKGKPLYELARQGEPVQKPAREVEISAIELLDMQADLDPEQDQNPDQDQEQNQDIRFSVSCGPGVYIRALAADMGQALGCGAHLKALRRTACCGFSVSNAVLPDILEAECREGNIEKRLIPMTEALKGMPECRVDDKTVEKIRHGIRLATDEVRLSGEPAQDGYLKIIDEQNRLLAVAQLKIASDVYDYCCVLC